MTKTSSLLLKTNFDQKDQTFAGADFTTNEEWHNFGLSKNLTELAAMAIDHQEKYTAISEKLDKISLCIQLSNLSDGFMLKYPINVLVKNDIDQFIAELVDINFYTIGETSMEAIDNLKIELIDYFKELKKDKDNLSPKLKSELSFLNSIVIEPNDI